MMTRTQPRCAICGYYQTDDVDYIGYRCVDESHWLQCRLFVPEWLQDSGAMYSSRHW